VAGTRWLRIKEVERAAFILTPSDDTSPAKRAIAGCDDRVTVLSRPVVAIQDHPVTGIPRLVGSGRVGEQGGVAARASACVQNREPCLTRRVEAPRGNPVKFVCRDSRAIFTIDGEQLRHARRVTTSDRHTHASQPVAQGIPDSRESLGAEPCKGRKASVMSCRFKIRKRLESQLLVEPIRKESANAGHRGKQPNGISVPP
jgi:hypothetical protein